MYSFIGHTVRMSAQCALITAHLYVYVLWFFCDQNTVCIGIHVAHCCKRSLGCIGPTFSNLFEQTEHCTAEAATALKICIAWLGGWSRDPLDIGNQFQAPRYVWGKTYTYINTFF